MCRLKINNSKKMKIKSILDTPVVNFFPFRYRTQAPLQTFPASRARLSLFSARCCVIFAVLIPPLSSLDHNYGSIERAPKFGAAWWGKNGKTLKCLISASLSTNAFLCCPSPPTIQVIRPRTAHSNHVAVMRLRAAITLLIP